MKRRKNLNCKLTEVFNERKTMSNKSVAKLVRLGCDSKGCPIAILDTSNPIMRFYAGYVVKVVERFKQKAYKPLNGCYGAWYTTRELADSEFEQRRLA